MNQKVLPGVLLFLLIISGIVTPFIGGKNLIKQENGAKSPSTHTRTGSYPPSRDPPKTQTRPSMENGAHQKQPKASKGKTEGISAQGEEWTKDPGDWWNTQWGYRKNMTLDETEGVDRNNWPVDVFVTFSPSAYKYSLRVVNKTGNEIPSQPWNLTYARTAYLSSATLTFLTNIPEGGNKTYQIYWSTNSTIDPPSYSNALSTQKDGTYVIESLTTHYKVETGGTTTGGKVIQVTLPSGDVINQSISHFGITENPNTTYNDYWGENDTNKQYDARGFVNEGSSLFDTYRGTIFVRYQIQNISFTDYAEVDLTYTFYPSFWTVKEEIKWTETHTTETEYYTSGWVFDQDDGDKETFNHVRDPEGFTHMNQTGVEPGLNLTVYDTTGYDTYADNHKELVDLTDPSNSYVSFHATTFTTQAISWHDDSEVPISPSPPEEHFSTMYQGLIYINESGTWGFATDSDDASELMIDGTVVASYYGAHANSGGPYHTGSIDLQEGYHSFTYRQHERTGAEDAVAYWKSPSGSSYEIIPGSAYYHSPEPTAISVAEAEDFYNDGSDWDRIAFLHGEESRGIGISWMNESGLTPDQERFQWYNEGNDSVDDYLYWSRSLTLSGAETSDHLTNTYGIIPWSPSGSSVESRLTQFNNIYYATQHPLQPTIASRERFKLKVTIHVKDRDGNGIKGATVKLTDGPIANYSGVTNGAGNVTFDLKRAWYNITVNITSGGHTYTNVSVDGTYNATPYATHEVSEVIQFPYLVHVLLHAENSEGSNIQNGKLRLKNDTASDSWIINATTNLTGWIDLQIPATDYWWQTNHSWNLTFNGDQEDDTWDTFNLSEIGGAKIGGQTKHISLNITSNVSYLLIDLDVGKIPPSELLWKNYAAPDPNPTWGEIINGTVILRTENGTHLAGNLTWKLLGGSDSPILQEKISDFSGSYFFELNTSNLPAGKTYTLNVTAIPQQEIYSKPVPLLSTITVDPVPTSLDTKYYPVVEWKDRLEITADYCISGEPAVSKATVKVTITKGNVTVRDDLHLVEVSTGRYKTVIDPVNFTSGIGDYNLKFEAYKANYSSVVDYEVLTVNPRSTDLSPWKVSVSIPWQANYTFTANYQDKADVNIGNATVQYTMNNPETGSTVLNGNMTPHNGAYEATMQIEGSGLTTMLYLLTITAERENYAKQTATVPFELKRRDSYLQPNTTSVKVTYTEQVAIKFHYEDLSYGTVPFGSPNISGATTTYYIPDLPGGGNKTGSLHDLGNGDYLFNISSTALGVGSCRLYVNVAKSPYTAGSERIPIEVKTIPTLVSSPNKKSVIWGEYLTFQFTITNLLNGTGVKGVNSTVMMNGASYTEYLTEKANGTYMFNVTTRDLNVDTYIFVFTFTKEKYTIESFTTAVTINSLAEQTEITYETMPTDVRKNPVTGGILTEATEVTISLYDNAHNRLLTGAKVRYHVEGIDSGYFTEQTPGTYVASIDWSKAKVGESYRINSTVVSVTLAGQEIELPSDMRVGAIADENVFVDYWGGSIKIGGFPLPNVWLYVIIGGVVALSSYGSFQLYNYLTTPPEVRELRELIANAQEGSFEYALITKEEMVEQKLEERIKT